MLRHFRIFALLASAVIILGIATADGHAASAAPVGEKNVQPIDANGLLKIIGSHKGKVVVVNIFASWCPPCREEVPGLIKVRQEFSADKVEIIGISVDKTPKALYNFMDDMKFNYPVYIAQGKFEETVGVTAIPQLLIYAKSGDLVTNHKGLVEADELIAALKKLDAEKP